MGNRSRFLWSLLLTGYLIGVHDGRVALWQGQAPEPVYVTSYAAAALPAADQAALAAGIPAGSRAQASRILEDFSS